jgi:hypothetical protein
MDIITSFLQAISSVTGPLTLLAFIVVALLAALLLVLKSTKGIERTQELLFRDAGLRPGEFVKIVNRVLWVLLAIAAMLFALLAYDYYTNSQRAKLQTGPACYADACTGRDPKDSGCDKGADTITSSIASFPDLGKDYKNIKLEMRYSSRCNASWVKSPPVIGATIYFESKEGKRYVPLSIKDDGIKDPHYTDMLSGELERRACIEYPGNEPQCTNFIK